MNMKKLILVCGLALVVVASVSSVNAGWFDFLEGNMTEHNFGNFSMKIPKNSTFKEVVQPNGNESMRAMAVKYTENGIFNLSFSDPKWADPKYGEYLHPAWESNEYNLVVEYINCKEDNLTFDNVVQTLYPSAEQIKKEDKQASYRWNDYNQTIVVNNNKNESLVIVRSNDTNLLDEMTNSLQFK